MVKTTWECATGKAKSVYISLQKELKKTIDPHHLKCLPPVSGTTTEKHKYSLEFLSVQFIFGMSENCDQSKNNIYRIHSKRLL